MTRVITYHRVYNYINTTCATSGAGTAYHSIVPELNQLFQLYRGGQFNCWRNRRTRRKRKIRGSGWLLFVFHKKPLYEACLIRIKEHVSEKRSTAGTHRYADCQFIMLYTSPWSRFALTTSVVIGTDYIGSCKSNYHTIMTMTAPTKLGIYNYITDGHMFNYVLRWRSYWISYLPASIIITLTMNKGE
jgi:hypothetical protein